MSFFFQRCMNLLDVGARESLSDVISKVLRKVANQPEGKDEDLDDTLLTWSVRVQEWGLMRHLCMCQKLVLFQCDNRILLDILSFKTWQYCLLIEVDVKFHKNMYPIARLSCVCNYTFSWAGALLSNSSLSTYNPMELRLFIPYTPIVPSPGRGSFICQLCEDLFH